MPGSKRSLLLKPGADFQSDLLIPISGNEHYLCTPTKGAASLRDADLDFAGISQLAEPYHANRKNCWHHIVLFTVDGLGELTLNGKKHPLKPGAVCILPAGLSHGYQPARGAHWRMVWFHPKPTTYWNQQIGPNVQIKASLFGQKIEMFAEALWSELESTDPDSRDATRIISQALLHYLGRELKQNENATRRRWRLRLEAIWDKISASPAEWNVSAIANHAGCSRTQLHQLCLKIYGITPREKLTQLRLQRASEYLLLTDWTLEEIASRVGYSDAFSFSKSFQRSQKESPAAYRRAKQDARSFPE